MVAVRVQWAAGAWPVQHVLLEFLATVGKHAIGQAAIGAKDAELGDQAHGRVSYGTAGPETFTLAFFSPDKTLSQ